MPCFARRQCNSALSDPPHPVAKDSRIESPKVNPKSVTPILNSKSGLQQATICLESTTDSPSKNHILATHFRQKPCKTTKSPSPKNHSFQILISGIAPPNTNGSLLLDRIQIIVEVGGLSNDEVYTNSHRGFGLRVIFCHIRNVDRNRSTLQHELLRENRPASGGPVVPAVYRPGRFQIRLPDQLPGYAHLLPLCCYNQ
jgi:hypothetical protein